MSTRCRLASLSVRPRPDTWTKTPARARQMRGPCHLKNELILSPGRPSSCGRRPERAGQERREGPLRQSGPGRNPNALVYLPLHGVDCIRLRATALRAGIGTTARPNPGDLVRQRHSSGQCRPAASGHINRPSSGQCGPGRRAFQDARMIHPVEQRYHPVHIVALHESPSGPVASPIRATTGTLSLCLSKRVLRALPRPQGPRAATRGRLA